MARAKALISSPTVTKFPLRIRLLLPLMADIIPGIVRPRTTSPKNGKAQTISLPPLPNGGTSMSERKTRTSVPSASIPVIKEKYILTPLLYSRTRRRALTNRNGLFSALSRSTHSARANRPPLGRRACSARLLRNSDVPVYGPLI